MIQQLEIKNFKAFRQATIDFERLTVLVGANSSGKTSVLEALHVFARCTQGVHHGESPFGVLCREGVTLESLHHGGTTEPIELTWRLRDGSDLTLLTRHGCTKSSRIRAA